MYPTPNWQWKKVIWKIFGGLCEMSWWSQSSSQGASNHITKNTIPVCTLVSSLCREARDWGLDPSKCWAPSELSGSSACSLNCYEEWTPRKRLFRSGLKHSVEVGKRSSRKLCLFCEYSEYFNLQFCYFDTFHWHQYQLYNIQGTFLQYSLAARLNIALFLKCAVDRAQVSLKAQMWVRKCHNVI